jgi:iron complex outermembrane receptor protein
MSKKLFILSLGMSLILFMGVIPQIFAQESQNEEFILEEIIVTAEKRETNLQKTPVSVQTVAGTELVLEAKQRIDEIMQGVVGVSSQGSQVGTSFYMRGLGTADYGPPVGGVTQSAVAVMIDGVYQNRGEVVRGGTVDMAQAEVMRGTQSTTLGGSSLAGAISLVSNDPVFKYEGSGSLGFGDYHLMTFQGVLNVPLADNQAIRLAFASEKRDGYLSSNAGNSDQRNARIKYRWQPSETFDIVATINAQDIGGNGVDTGVLTYDGYWEGYVPAKDRANGCTSDCYNAIMGDPAMYGHLPGVDYDQRDNPWDDGYPPDSWPNNPFRHTTIEQYSADINWDLGLGTLTVTPSYQKARFRSQEPPRGNSWRAEDQKQETSQIDTQLTSAADSKFEWLAGVYWYDTTFSNLMPSVSLNGTGGPGPPGGPCSPAPGAEHTWCWSSTDPNEQTTYAGYGDVSYPVLDKLTINAGLRYTHDMKSSRRATSDLLGTAAGPNGDFTYGEPTEGNWEALTYRVGGQYDLNEQAMVYAMYATGYQPGTLLFDGPNEEQTLEQITAGVKSRLLNNRLQLNLEGFSSTYHDRPMQGQLTYFSPNYYEVTGSSMCGNGQPGGPPYNYGVDPELGEYACYQSQSPTVPDMISMGADLEVNWLLTENDRIDASAEYLKSEMGEPTVPVTQSELEGYGMSAEMAAEVYNALTSQAAQYDGLVMQNSPKYTANVSYSHIFNLSGGSTLTPKINMEYRDTYWSQGGGPGANIVKPGDSVQDAYTLWNAYLNWTSSDGKFNVNAYMKNIDNKPIKTNLGVEPDPNAPQYVTLAPPRTFGVVFSAQW